MGPSQSAHYTKWFWHKANGALALPAQISCQFYVLQDILVAEDIGCIINELVEEWSHLNLGCVVPEHQYHGLQKTWDVASEAIRLEGIL